MSADSEKRLSAGQQEGRLGENGRAYMREKLPAEALEVLCRAGGQQGKHALLLASAQRINDLLFGLEGEVAILKEQSAPGSKDASGGQIHDIARGMESLLSVFDLMHGQMMGHLQALDEGERKGAS